MRAARSAVAQEEIDQGCESDRQREPCIKVIPCWNWFGRVRQAKRCELKPVKTRDGEKIQERLAFRHGPGRESRFDMSRAPDISVTKGHNDKAQGRAASSRVPLERRVGIFLRSDYDAVHRQPPAIKHEANFRAVLLRTYVQVRFQGIAGVADSAQRLS